MPQPTIYVWLAELVKTFVRTLEQESLLAVEVPVAEEPLRVPVAEVEAEEPERNESSFAALEVIETPPLAAADLR